MNTVHTLFSQITEVADKVGVGVHFNPFVSWNDRVKTSRETVGLSENLMNNLVYFISLRSALFDHIVCNLNPFFACMI